MDETRTRVHLITGFLGSGKTRFLNRLLAQRPAAERWAVIVNEFGSVGVDEALLSPAGQPVRQIAGGCLCCTTGPLLRVTLTRLLREVKPHRLLIEPSGLGHPQGVLDLLASPFLAGAVTAGATVCVVDPAQCLDARYREHDAFRQQLAAADAVLVSKLDVLAEDVTRQGLAALQEHCPAYIPICADRTLTDPLAWLDSLAVHQHQPSPTLLRWGAEEAEAAPLSTGYLQRSEAGVTSHGWRWLDTPAQGTGEAREQLERWCAAHADALWRGKAVLRDESGAWLSWQWVAGVQDWQPADVPADGLQRLELLVQADAPLTLPW